MKKLLYFLLLLATSPAFGYEYLIKGQVVNPGENATVSVYSEANPFIISEKVGPDGTFEVRGEFPVASQFMISYADDSHQSRYELYLFESDTVTANLDVGEQVEWELEGVPRLSEQGYEKTRAIWNSVRSENPSAGIDSLLALWEDSLVQASGNDQLAQVNARASKLSSMYLMVTPKMQHVYDIYSLSDFKQLPKFSQAYSGMPKYNRLMYQYLRKLVTDSLQAVKNDSTYWPDYQDYLAEAEKRKEKLPQPIYLQLKEGSFWGFSENGKTREEIDNYLSDVEAFMIEHPNYKETESLRSQYEEVKYSLVNQQAPIFQLADTSGKVHTFPNPDGKYVLLDVWGSWCAPCRFYNKHLVEWNEELKADGRVKLVGVAYDPNKADWKEAIVEDSLTWQQLHFTKEFIDAYHITGYPTMFLISPEGKVLAKGTQLREEDIAEFLEEE